MATGVQEKAWRLGAPTVPWALALALAASGGSLAAGAEGGSGGGGENAFQALTGPQEQGIEKGLGWLAKHQSKDGSWGAEGAGGSYQMAMSGLAGLAFLAAGHTPSRGRYNLHISRTIRWMLRNQQRGGAYDGLLSSPSEGQTMYGHGFAMTFLSQCYGMDPKDDEASAQLRTCLTNAVKLTARAQSSLGGWYYSPDSGQDEGSVTITQVQALRGCANVGIPIPAKVMQNALSYIHRAQNSDGGIRYSARGGGASSPSLSAAGAELLMMAGQYEAPETKKVVEYLKRNAQVGSAQFGHRFYTFYYCAQAMMQVGGTEWEKYFTALRRELLSTQGSDGSWQGDIGATYCTAIAVTLLALPSQYLPLYQK